MQDFFIYYLAAHGQPWDIIGGKPHSLDVNHAFVKFWPEGHREARNDVGSLSPAERLVWLELGTFQLLAQLFKPLGHSPQIVEEGSFCSFLENYPLKHLIMIRQWPQT